MFDAKPGPSGAWVAKWRVPRPRIRPTSDWELGVTPHVAQNTTNRRRAIDARTTRHGGYALSQRVRKRIEEILGWLKTVALFGKTRHRGVRRVGWLFTLAAALAEARAVFEALRLPRLVEETGRLTSDLALD